MLCNISHFYFHSLKELKRTKMEGIDMELEQKWEKIEGYNKELTQKLRKDIEEQKECEEKIKLFNELVQLDGEAWRVMVADLDKKEQEDRQKEQEDRYKRCKQMEQEEQEDWDRHLKEVAERLKIIEFFKELPENV